MRLIFFQGSAPPRSSPSAESSVMLEGEVLHWRVLQRCTRLELYHMPRSYGGTRAMVIERKPTISSKLCPLNPVTWSVAELGVSRLAQKVTGRIG